MPQYPSDPADSPQPDPFAPSLPDQVGSLPSDSSTHNHHASMYTNPLAIGSLVAGLFSVLIVTTCFCSGPFALIGSVTSVIAIILGLIALSQIKVGNGTGRNLAISGIICGLLSLIVLIAFVSWFFLTPKKNVDSIQLPNADPLMIRIDDDKPPELPKAAKKGEVQLIPARPSARPQQPPKNQQTAPKEPD